MEKNNTSLKNNENEVEDDNTDNEKMQFLNEIFTINEEEEKKEEEVKIEDRNIINIRRPRRKKLSSSEFLIYFILFLVILIFLRNISLSQIKICMFIALLISLLSFIKKKKGILLKKIMEQISYMKIILDSIKSKLNNNNSNNNQNNNNESETQRLNDNSDLEDPLLNI